MLLNPRLTVVFACGFALLLFAIYHSTLYRGERTVRNAGGGAGTNGLHVDTRPAIPNSIHTSSPSHSASPEPKLEHPEPPTAPTLEDTIQQLFAPLKHPDFVTKFTDPEGTVYEANNNIWTEPLGKDLLIVDVDTRYPELLFDAEKKVDWEHSDNLVTQAVFNHYLYATIHGYSYHYYRPNEVPDHHQTWPKVHSIYNLLPDYKFVVFLDADASIRHLHMPFEWLLNRWNVTRNTSFTMARDPLDIDCNLCDSNGVAMVNTGFVVAQNLPYTFEIFDAWMKCTNGGTRYQDCEKWRNKWAHEQAVFSDYLRYDYNPDGDNIRELECGEANGFPGHMWYDPVECNGKFIRHHTFVKGMMKETAANSVMQAFLDLMKSNFAKIGDELIVNEAEEDEKKSKKQKEKQQKEDKTPKAATKRA